MCFKTEQKEYIEVKWYAKKFAKFLNYISF
jgi:hypothetical protein